MVKKTWGQSIMLPIMQLLSCQRIRKATIESYQKKVEKDPDSWSDEFKAKLNTVASQEARTVIKFLKWVEPDGLLSYQFLHDDVVQSEVDGPHSSEAKSFVITATEFCLAQRGICKSAVSLPLGTYVDLAE